MNLRNVLLVLLVLLVLSHFVGMPFIVGGPIGLLLLIVLICVLAGVL